MKSQLLIGAATSGSGKTLFTMGLLRALKKRGLQVQPFKCGPDCLDPLFHALATGNESVNLDTWMASHTHLQQVYNKYGERADVCVVEGVKGLFDGYRKTQGSSAEIARLLRIPVVLIVPARTMAYSVAALISGFKHFDPTVKIAGVIFNQVASPAQFAFLREACADAGVECLGYLPDTGALKLSSRYRVFTLTVRKEVGALIEQVAELIEQYVDVDKLLNLCQRSFPCRYTLPFRSEQGVESFITRPKLGRIAVARDPAFSFIYPENIARLAEWGDITYFSPVYGSDLPEADLVYLPGGHAELFARQLHRRRKLMEDLRNYAEAGGKIWAEGSGVMFLSRSVKMRSGGPIYPMAGLLPLDFDLENARLQQGYRQIVYHGKELRGYAFHSATVLNPDALPSVARTYNLKGGEMDTPMYRYKNVIAGFTRLYWGETNLLRLWEE